MTDKQQPGNNRWRTAWRSLATSGSKAAWWAAGGILVLGVLVTFIWFGLAFMRIYGDGYTIERPAAYSALRYVLWEDPNPLPADFNGLTANEDSALSPDGLTLVITRRFDRGNRDLFIAHKVDGKWSKLEPLSMVNSPANEGGPCFSADGGTLYFHSDRTGGSGRNDLYRVRLEASGWSLPMRLPDNVNSPYDDLYPTLTDLGSLMFSSDRFEGTPAPGQPPDYDLYVAHSADEGGFKEPAPMAELNTQWNELQATITARGDLLYFSSDRPGGEGGYDLYLARVRPNEPMAVENLASPINSPRDEKAPKISADGFRLQMISNRATGGGLDYQTFTTQSREVTLRLDYAVLRNLLLILLLLWVCAMALHYLLKLLLAEGSLRLVPKCLLASVFLHLLLLALSATWFLTTRLEEKAEQRRDAMVVSLNNLARESVALAVRESVASLPRLKAAPPSERTSESVLPPREAPVAQESVPVAMEAVQEQVVETRAETEAFANSPAHFTPKEANVLAKPFEPGMTELAMEMPEGFNQSGSDDAQTPLPPKQREPEKLRPLRSVEIARIAPEMTGLPQPVAEAPTVRAGESISSVKGLRDLARVDPDNAPGRIDDRDMVEETLLQGSGPTSRNMASSVGTVLLGSAMAMESSPLTSRDAARELGLLSNDPHMAGRNDFGVARANGRAYQPLVMLEALDMDAPMAFDSLALAKFLARLEELNRVGNLLAAHLPRFELSADAELEVPESMLRK